MFQDPPEFTPYDAVYFVSATGDVVSHDPHLNEDGEALYRFLLSQAVTPPRLLLHCRGSHDETHSHFVRSEHDGDGMRTEQYTETVVDFDFKIDVGQHILPGVTHWSAGDSAPAYRGRMFRQVGVGSKKRRAKRAELKAAKAWDNALGVRGYAPWIGNNNNLSGGEDQLHVIHDDTVLKSSWTFRQWADDYCSSNMLLKDFEYHKVVYGWNFDTLIAAIRSAIISTHYRGDIQVSFETLNSVISIRSHNRLSRALSNGWLKLLLIITFVYPFLWLFRRFHPQGGGIWRVCGGAYALNRVEQASSPPEYPGNSKTFHNPLSDAAPVGNSGQASGSHAPVTGLREGIWFAQWERTIRRAVLDRLRESEPLLSQGGASPPVPIVLDSYGTHQPLNAV